MESSDGSLEELRHHCRTQANKAEQQAEQLSPAYLEIAQAWRMVAMEIDKVIARRATTPAEQKRSADRHGH